MSGQQRRASRARQRQGAKIIDEQRRARMTPEQRARDDRNWTIFGAVILVVVLATIGGCIAESGHSTPTLPMRNSTICKMGSAQAAIDQMEGTGANLSTAQMQQVYSIIDNCPL